MIDCVTQRLVGTKMIFVLLGDHRPWLCRLADQPFTLFLRDS